MTPEVPDAGAAIAEPPSARPRLQYHLQRLAVRSSVAFTKPVEHASKEVANSPQEQRVKTCMSRLHGN